MNKGAMEEELPQMLDTVDFNCRIRKEVCLRICLTLL